MGLVVFCCFVGFFCVCVVLFGWGFCMFFKYFKKYLKVTDTVN